MTTPTSQPQAVIPRGLGLRPNWWHHRNWHLDDIIDAIRHITETEIHDIEQQATQEATELGLDEAATDLFVTDATREIRQEMHTEAQHAIRDVTSAHEHDVADQVARHRRGHGCYGDCPLIRARR